MTPRPNMVTIRAGDTLAQLHELVVHEQFSRIPVCQTSIDDIIGFVHVRDMFEVAESDRPKRTVRESDAAHPARPGNKIGPRSDARDAAGRLAHGDRGG